MGTDPIPGGLISFSGQSDAPSDGSSEKRQEQLAGKRHLREAGLAALTTPRSARGLDDSEGSPRYPSARLYEDASKKERRMEEKRQQALAKEKRWMEDHSVHQGAALHGHATGSSSDSVQPAWERLSAEAQARTTRLEEMRRRREAEDKAMAIMASRPPRPRASPSDVASAEPCWVKLQAVAKEREAKLEQARRLKETDELQWLQEVSVHKAKPSSDEAGGAKGAADRPPVYERCQEYGMKREQKLEEKRRKKSREERQWLEQHNIHQHGVRAPPEGEGGRPEPDPSSPPRWQQLYGKHADREQRLEEKRQQQADEEQRWLQRNSVHRTLSC